MATQQDTRSPEVIAAQEELAKKLLPADLAADSVEYQVRIALAAVGGGVLEVGFYAKEGTGKQYSQFEGGLGGACAGGSLVWGTAWMNSNIETYNGQSARFALQGGPVWTSVQWWDMSGNYIGWALGGGFGAAACIAGGQGTFTNVS